MKYRFAVLFIAVIMFVMLFMTACGENADSTKDEAVPATAAVSETTLVLETTSDGGTVEQDSEGNKITKNREGIVTRVEDKAGNPVEVTEYLSTHSWVENATASGGNDNSQKTDDSGNPTSSDNSSSSVSGGSNGKNDNKKNNSSASENDEVEDEIPVIVATIPDDEDLAELPDL